MFGHLLIDKTTLIFNSSISTSRLVEQFFIEKDYEHKIQHLDSTFSDKDRKRVLDWFKKTPGAILTSVGILTTGFDEPSVEVILLNRATRSIALYHQMVGRGSRIYPKKTTFYIIDLGNNAKRFGLWGDRIDWEKVFKNPTWFLDQRFYGEDNECDFTVYERPIELSEKLHTAPKEPDFSVKTLYKTYNAKNLKSSLVIDKCIENHLEWIELNASNLDEALELFELFKDEMQYRIHGYGKCINASGNYLTWLTETYEKKIERSLRLTFDEQ
jgi:type I site-specific restriction endonuclease